MRALRWAAVLMAGLMTVGLEALPSKMELKPKPGTVFLDDIVFLRLRYSSQSYNARPLIESSGFRVVMDYKSYDGVFVYLYPTETGYATIGPIRLVDENNKTLETLPRARYQIRESADNIAEDPIPAVRRLKELGRSPITIRSSPTWIRTYPGQTEIVSFEATYLPEAALDSLSRPAVPETRGLIIEETVDTFRLGSARDMGLEVAKTLVGRWTITATEPGTYSIDPGWLRCHTSGSQMTQYRRQVPSIVVEVRAAPEGVDSNLPIGDFKLRCPSSVYRTGMEAVAANVQVEGSGIIRGSIHTEAGTPRPVLIRMDEGERKPAKKGPPTYRANAFITLISLPRSSTEVELPAVTFDYWSPTTGSRESARCEAVTLAVEPLAQLTSTVKESPLPKGMGFTLMIFEILALALLAFSGYWLFKAFR